MEERVVFYKREVRESIIFGGVSVLRRVWGDWGVYFKNEVVFRENGKG